jgi:hypothetical protein
MTPMHAGIVLAICSGGGGHPELPQRQFPSSAYAEMQQMETLRMVGRVDTNIERLRGRSNQIKK